MFYILFINALFVLYIGFKRHYYFMKLVFQTADLKSFWWFRPALLWQIFVITWLTFLYISFKVKVFTYTYVNNKLINCILKSPKNTENFYSLFLNKNVFKMILNVSALDMTVTICAKTEMMSGDSSDNETCCSTYDDGSKVSKRPIFFKQRLQLGLSIQVCLSDVKQFYWLIMPCSYQLTLFTLISNCLPPENILIFFL